VHAFGTSSAICSESVSYKAFFEGRCAPPSLRPASAALKSEKTHHSEVAKFRTLSCSVEFPSLECIARTQTGRYGKGSINADCVGSTDPDTKAGTVFGHSFLVGIIRDTVDPICAN